MLSDGLTVGQIAAQLTARNYAATPRHVANLKAKHKLARQWKGSDAQLDSIVHGMRVKGDFGPDEGYRWVAEQINKKPLSARRAGQERGTGPPRHERSTMLRPHRRSRRRSP